ncbi:serine hydrolase, partial [Falsiroseomonas sp.]|uniref:serine hydrolase domain-containing protein n=1 Tax=Falsiroseomonas sp. TaxID=2870721 RepID=UPI002716A6D3
DHIIYKRNFGSADLDKNTPITETTIFDIASASKQFTGMAIALLEEQGKINIDDKIIKYLPDLSEAMSDITVYQLVHHTSGIRDWPTLFALKGWQLEKPLSLDDIYDILKKQESLNFTPGTEFSYSNSNYNLLAKIVEAVTDTSFESWVQDNIFVPLVMKNTYFVKNSNLEENNLANSYYFDGNEYSLFANNLNAYGSSSIMSSTADMLKWLTNFKSKILGGDVTFNKITQKGNLSNSKTIDYGYGLYITEINGKKAYYHDGAWGGYRSGIVFFPEESVGVVFLSNNGTLNPKKILNDIADILFGNKTEKKTKESVSTEQEINDEFFALCAGKYQQVDDKK